MKSTPFQLIVTGVFVVFLLVGVGIFALFGGSGRNGGVGTVSIWGTEDASVMNHVLDDLRTTDKSFQNVSYTQKDTSTYQQDLTNAMASGTGPDLFLVSQDDAHFFANKISVIPYATLAQSTFTTSYVDEGQLFLTPKGTLALPVLIDPLVLYWNKDLFASAGIPQPPQYWSDVLSIAPRLTTLDGTSNVTRSAIALGVWSNIAHAKEILASLFLQAGDSILSTAADGSTQVSFGMAPTGSSENPTASALSFYTQFSDPTKLSYTWNRSLPRSADAFTGGTLAMYIGFASDYPTLAARNPNIHFAVSPLPQIQGSATRLTFGELTGVAIARTSGNPNGALIIAQKLSSQTGVSAFVTQSGLPPVRRDVAVDTSASAEQTVFAQSALIARAWLDPDQAATSGVFQTMVESVISGASQSLQAVGEAQQSLQRIVTSSTAN